MWPIWWVKTKLVELRQRCIMYSHVDWPLPCICCYNFILLPRQSKGSQGKFTSSNHTLWDKLCPRKQKNLHAVYSVWDTWPEAEVAILQMSVFLGATDKPAKTAHTATAKGQPNSLSEASLWRGLKFPARMMFLQQEIHLTWLNCNFGKVKVNLETTLEGQRLSPRQAGLCGVPAGPAGAYMWFQKLALLVLLCWSLRIRRQMHISHNVPCFPTKILHNLYFSFFLGIIAVPREIENNAYAKVWGVVGGGGGGKKGALWEMCEWRIANSRLKISAGFCSHSPQPRTGKYGLWWVFHWTFTKWRRWVVSARFVAMVTSKAILPFALQAFPPLRNPLPSACCRWV